MASTTTNLGLTKPAYTDDADVAVINANSDIIDAAYGSLSDQIANKLNNSYGGHTISLVGDATFFGFDIRVTGDSNFFRLNFFDTGKVSIARYSGGAWRTEVTLRNAD